MNFTIPSNNLPFTIVIGIKTSKPENIQILASDMYKPNTNYLLRNGVINGYREFELKFPQSPKIMVLSVFNTSNGNFKNSEDNSFKITNFDVKKLKTYPLWQDSEIREFIKFAKFFCENAGVIEAGDFKPTILRSDNNKFTIDYYNKIRNRSNGMFVNTPARIGHSTGTIEVSKSDFIRYTIPMRMIILLHEFSHKYMNPKVGRDISDEISADINAANIYLSLGYPNIEAHYAFGKVFKGADNIENRKRLVILNDFITKFNNGELSSEAVELAKSLKK
jgi:hypothetical protein